ncbi:MAG: hypothetical protein WC884_03475 [Candidatus Paceibacterota bacterium]
MQNNSYNFKKFKKIPFLFSIIFLGFSCFVFIFLYKEINKNQVVSEKMQIEWQDESDRRDEIKSLERSIKTIKEDRILLESHFAQSSDVVKFLDTIEKLAFAVEIKPEVVSVDIVKDKSILLVVIRTFGSFESIYKFLKLLENSSYELEFSSFEMARTNIQIDSNKKVINPEWSATFKIQLLSFIL